MFSQAGATDTGALFASWGFGLVNFLFAFPVRFPAPRHFSSASSSHHFLGCLDYCYIWTTSPSAVHLPSDGLDSPGGRILLLCARQRWSSSGLNRPFHLPLCGVLLSRRRSRPLHLLCGSVPSVSSWYVYSLSLVIVEANSFHRGRYVLGCRNLPRLGRRALDYLPPNALCHDPNRRILLLRVSSGLDSFFP